ncbi:bifunctional nuclease family protein [Candidatus Bipolaricaulota bacterium]|nr:bifunctional nuclease family protein [Candidatus Bipolaricaulota bacterium]MBU1692323.1 bifunctional nuclease family protein [Gammaproteobacteria bacterium]
MREVVIKALLVDPSNNTPVVLLKDRASRRAMPIWIGEPEAMSIAFGLQSEEFPRPLTHVLMARLIEGLKASVDRVIIKSCEDATYYASVLLRDVNGELHEYDARASDSLALSLRSGCPIFVAEDVFDDSAIESPFADEDEFHEFVESDLDLDVFRKLSGGSGRGDSAREET